MEASRCSARRGSARRTRSRRRAALPSSPAAGQSRAAPCRRRATRPSPSGRPASCAAPARAAPKARRAPSRCPPSRSGKPWRPKRPNSFRLCFMRAPVVIAAVPFPVVCSVRILPQNSHKCNLFFQKREIRLTASDASATIKSRDSQYREFDIRRSCFEKVQTILPGQKIRAAVLLRRGMRFYFLPGFSHLCNKHWSPARDRIRITRAPICRELCAYPAGKPDRRRLHMDL